MRCVLHTGAIGSYMLFDRKGKGADGKGRAASNPSYEKTSSEKADGFGFAVAKGGDGTAGYLEVDAKK